MSRTLIVAGIVVCLMHLPARAAPRYLLMDLQVDLHGFAGNALSPHSKLGGAMASPTNYPAARGTASAVESLPLLPGGYGAYVVSILDDLTAFGMADDGIETYAVRWEVDGSINVLPSRPEWVNTSLNGANKSKVTVGYGVLGDVNTQVFTDVPVRWQADGTLELLPAPSENTGAFAINDAGLIVLGAIFPDGSQHAYILDTSNVYHDLGTLGGPYTAGLAIDRDGVVTGVSKSTAVGTFGNYHAVLGGIGLPLQALPDLPNAPNCQGEALQSAKVVVGLCNMFPEYTGGENSIATLWLNGQPYDLNTLLVDGADWWLEEAFAINQAGLILARGIFQGGLHSSDYRTVLLVPQALQNFVRLWERLGLPPLP